jgi:tetratricopeptide (TPR) repeat protein
MRASCLVVVLSALAIFAGGCLQSKIEENTRQLQEQQAELDKLKQEVAAINAPQSNATPLPAGACDTDVSREATRKGGERFAASAFGEALGYYQDALAACPGDAHAELNLARTYEALGNRADAISHYKNAAKDAGKATDQSAQEARDALSRLGVK